MLVFCRDAIASKNIQTWASRMNNNNADHVYENPKEATMKQRRTVNNVITRQCSVSPMSLECDDTRNLCLRADQSVFSPQSTKSGLKSPTPSNLISPSPSDIDGVPRR